MIDYKFIIRKYYNNTKDIFKSDFPEPIILKRLKYIKGHVFFDIGANSGMYSIALRKNFKKIYSFEPDTETFWKLDQCSRFGNIMPFKIAISNNDGYVELHHPKDMCPTILNEFRYCPNSHPEVNILISELNGEKTSSSTIDSFITKYSIPLVDLVKVDVEGAEFMVLEGSKKTLFEGRINNIIIELHNRERKKELENILIENNFNIRWVDDDHILGVHEKGYNPNIE